MANKELSFINTIKAFGIILVVIGHSVPIDRIADNPAIVSAIWYGIYTFHMPLFFSISGFLYFLTRHEKKYSTVLWNRFRRLLIPYFTISFLAIFPRLIFNPFAVRTLSFDLYSLFEAIFYPIRGPIRYYWYLPALFNIYLTITLVNMFMNRENIKRLLLITSLLFLVYIGGLFNTGWWSIGDSFYYAGYFYIGYTFALIYARKSLVFAFQTTTLHVLCVIFVSAAYIYWTPIVQQTPILKIVRITGALAAVVIVWRLLVNTSISSTIITVLSSYSYQIFLLSFFPQVLIKILYQQGLMGYWQCLLLMFFTGIIIPVAIAEYINRKLPVLKPVIGMRTI